MKLRAATLASFSLLLTACAHPGGTMKDPSTIPAAPTLDDVGAVSPALARYTATVIGDLWKRPGLTPRDRSIVTLSVLVSRHPALDLAHHVELALDSGVTPGEVSEILTHLAFYAGWGNATAAVAVTKPIFERRGIGPAELPPATGELLPLDQAAETQRAARVEESFGAIAPGVVAYTTDVLFHDLWLRKALAPRDRSLVTVVALVATGQVAQLPYHLDRAMNHGLTAGQISEVLTHVAFYTGWPSVFTALPVVKDVLEKRKSAPSR